VQKGQHWYFRAEACLDIDNKDGRAHSVCTSTASDSSVHMSPDLLHGEEKKLWGNGGNR